MLSGKGNKNGEKTIIGLISKKKKNFARAAHFSRTFICRSLHDTKVKRPETSWLHFNGGNVELVLVHFFFNATHFPGWPVAFLISSPPLQIHNVLPTKKWLLISRSSSPSLFFSLSFACLSPAFLFLYIPNLWT